MTINEILRYSIKELKEKNIDEPILKSKMLVCNVLNKEKEYLITNMEQTLTKKEVYKVKCGIKKLSKNIPIQYIINKQEFMKLVFFVNKNVLIPQPDTESLVEEVIKILKEKRNAKVLDLCTGSGIIAISICKNTETEQIIASDISRKALKVAKINCKKHTVENKIKLKHSNLFNNINEKFDVIVSNPPYIETNILKTLDEEVKKEPKIALDGGQAGGLDFYKKIINNAYKYLQKDGYLCLEIGHDQKEKVINLIKQSEKYCQITSKQDLSGIDRVIICKLK